MNAPITLVAGQKFARLTVIEVAVHPGTGKRAWRCRCDCGNETIKEVSTLLLGVAKSCGCYNASSERTPKHGGARRGRAHPLYNIWKAMRQRCNQPNDPAYKRYGGRGIKVCPEWDAFERFLSDMGPRPDGHSIDRIDNDGDYTPANCHWATRIQQARNQRKTVWITHDGVTRPLREWAEILSIPDKTIYKRLRCGNPPLTMPVAGPEAKGEL